MLWSIYIIELDNRGNKTKHYGHTKEYYTGITGRTIAERFKEHLTRRCNSYVSRYWKDARKILVYLEYLEGTRSDAEQREKQIKRYTRERKESLIKSEDNKLIVYVPCKCIVVKKPIEGEEVFYL